MLRAYRAPLEADFQRYYHLDLSDLYRGRLGVWKVARLASQLPPEGAVGRATAGQGYRKADYLLLDLIDLLAAGNWQRANAGAPKHKQTKPPTPVPRPGEQKPKPRITAAQLLDFQRRTETR